MRFGAMELIIPIILIVIFLCPTVVFKLIKRGKESKRIIDAELGKTLSDTQEESI